MSERDMSEPDTSKSDLDTIIVQDQASRRRFIRSSAAFVIAGSTAALATGVRADDCDRAQTGNTDGKKTAAGSDSDAGASADPSGCGRRDPQISLNTPEPAPASPAPVVARVKS